MKVRGRRQEKEKKKGEYFPSVFITLSWLNIIDKPIRPEQ